MSAPELKEGDWIDVLDGDGIWNVAQVLRLPSPETVEVTYDCWGDEYNEQLRRDSARIAPFHTHTWAVKCWAKLDTWPWWPALLTVRAPGSKAGAQNLRLEERLLVDFLDSPDFTERCRCWVKKTKIVPFQSDEETRKRRTNRKKKWTKGEARLESMELSTELLAKCDAREDFPKFVVGTLPVQFAKKVTRPTAEVRKEMGEEIWLRGFAENRINHAATHAYTPKITAERESNDEDSTELPPSVDENGKSAPSGESRMHSENRSIVDTYPDKDTSTKDPKTQAKANLPLDASTLDKLKDAKSLKSRVDDPERPQQRKTGKRRKPAETDDETSGSTNSSHTEKTKVPREEVSTDSTKQLQSATSTADECPKEQQAETASISRSSKVLSVSPRKYGKTPKVKPRNDQHAAHDRRTAHPTQARRRAEKVVADKKVSAAKQKPAQARVATVRISSKASASDGPSSPMKILARLTKATLRANEKLQTVEQALEEKLSELAEKSAKAEKLRSRCASLPSDTRQVNREDPRRVKRTCVRPDASRVPALARRSSQAECDIRGLELALDDRLSKYQAITNAELDDIKADLMRCPEVQAAIARIQNPSYGWTTWTGTTSSLSSDRRRNKKHDSKLHHDLYLSQPSRQQPDRVWGYERESAASDEHCWGPSSLLLNARQADFTSFGFNLDDNFSMNQWHRDLYPRSFGYQRP